LTGKRLKTFLRSILGEKTFEDLKIPVKIMVYDLANRETLAIEKGLLVEAVYMSISVPGIFKPKIGQERMIVDGGVSDPVPVDVLFKEGVKKIIAVNVMPGHEDIYERNMILKKRLNEEENILRTSPFYIRLGLRVKRFFRKIFMPNIFDVIMTCMQAMEHMLAENSCKKADVVLRPVYRDATSIDFHLVKNFIRKGEEETMLHISQIKQLAEQ
jgi:NTE family protein